MLRTGADFTKFSSKSTHGRLCHRPLVLLLRPSRRHATGIVQSALRLYMRTILHIHHVSCMLAMLHVSIISHEVDALHMSSGTQLRNAKFSA